MGTLLGLSHGLAVLAVIFFAVYAAFIEPRKD